MKDKLPRLFIGSSVEGLRIAEAIQAGLEYAAESTIWSQGVFGLAGGTLESLAAATRRFDFAVLVVTPDDMVTKRDQEVNAPRDNVVFELGLFMGALGRDRVAMVYNRDADVALPTDVAGVTAATFPERADGNLEAALGPVCMKLKAMMAAKPSTEGTFVSHAERVEEILERLIQREEVAKRADEALSLRSELEKLQVELETLRELAKEVLCPHCSSPALERGFGSEMVEYNGRDVDIEHAWVTYECGYEVFDGRIRKPCPNAK